MGNSNQSTDHSVDKMRLPKLRFGLVQTPRESESPSEATETGESPDDLDTSSASLGSVPVKRDFEEFIDPSTVRKAHQLLKGVGIDDRRFKDLCRRFFGDFVIDESRYNFIWSLLRTLQSVSKGMSRKTGADGRFKLLTGQLGVGKTYLLKTCLAMAEETFPNMIVQFVDFQKTTKFRLPSMIMKDAIKKHLGLDVEIPDGEEPLDAVENVLLENGKCLFLVIDEVQTVFSEEDTDRQDLCKEIINELIVIGSGGQGVIHCVISGSSSDTRKLCFGKLPREDPVVKSMYPVYQGKSLNGSKFGQMCISPILLPGQFRKAVAIVRRQLGLLGDVEEDLVRDLYVSSGGNFRQLRTLLGESDMNPKSDKFAKIDAIRQGTLQQLLLQKVRQYVARLKWSPPLTLEQMNSALTYYRFDSLLDEFNHHIEFELGEYRPETFEQLCLGLADRGVVGLKKSPIPGESECRWEQPGDVFTKDGQLRHDVLSYEDVLRLKNPRDYIPDDCERAMLRLLDRRLGTWLKSQDSSDFDPASHYDRDIGRLELKFMKTKGSSTEARAGIDSALGRVCKEIYKKDRDCLGADGVVLLLTDKGGQIEVHRVQVKLATTINAPIHEDMIADAIKKFKIHRKHVDELFTRLDFTKSVAKEYIVCTHFVSDGLKEVASKAGIMVLDYAFVYNNIMTSELQELFPTPKSLEASSSAASSGSGTGAG